LGVEDDEGGGEAVGRVDSVVENEVLGEGSAFFGVCDVAGVLSAGAWHDEFARSRRRMAEAFVRRRRRTSRVQATSTAASIVTSETRRDTDGLLPPYRGSQGWASMISRALGIPR